MTHEQFIELETAQLAKQAGFDWECIAYYKPEIFSNELKMSNLGLFGNMNHPQYSMVTEDFSAPTQAVLQRWLREKYDVHVSVMNWGYPTEYYTAHISGKMPNITLGNIEYQHGMRYANGKHFPTYEAALEAGLKHCLTLILEEQQRQ